MGKAFFVTPFYISIAWVLMVSYQLFTQTAVTTVITQIKLYWPSIGVWLSSRIEMIIFIYAFAWVFLLSSAIPSAILGKERGVLIQFLVCLTLTFLAFLLQDVLAAYGGRTINQIFSFAWVFQNPLLAICYLSIPYLLMFAIDLYSRRRRKKQREELERATDLFLEVAEEAEKRIEEM
jgi:hypothetical protein